MIKKLQKKFVIITMSSIFIVLFIILGIINISNYVNINRQADYVLGIITDNGGVFPSLNKIIGDNDKKKDPTPPHLSPEAPYENRFFTVYINSYGQIMGCNTNYIAAITPESALPYANEAYSSKKAIGFCGNYKFKISDVDNGSMIVFLDCSRSLSTFRNFLTQSILVAVGGLFVIFIIVLVSSKIAIAPVAESYAKQKRFITDASHELKTPLTVIDANTEVIEMESGESKWTKSTKNQVGRLTELTNNLVSLARMDEENAKLSLSEFSLSDTVCEASNNFVPLAETKGKQLITLVEPDIVYNGNSSTIKQLVSILLDNAIKYSNDNGIITVSLKKDGKRVVLDVYNTVDEIKIGNHPEFFERFYRADESRNSKKSGYGIGLSLAKSIVTLHKGKITAKSNDTCSLNMTVIL